MTDTSTTSYLHDPLYKSVLRHFHLGEWREGFAEIEQLMTAHPDEEELSRFREEMEVRARIDGDEAHDRKSAAMRKITTWTVRVAVVVILAGVIFWGTQTYSSWLQSRLSFANKNLDAEIRQIQLAVKFRDAQNLVVAGQGDLAQTLLNEIASVNPDYPGLQAEMEKAGNLKTLGAKYTQAMDLINKNELNAGLALLNDIKAQDPYFNDVSTRIQEVESKISIEGMLADAEAAYQAKDWQKAVTAYEAIRVTDPAYQTNLIEQRLLDSYMNAANAVMNANSSDVNNLGLAETYFRKALALRPQDPQLEKERDAARQKFSANLSFVYVQAAQEALKNHADSLDALKIAEGYFQKALDIQNDEKTQVQLELAQVYLQAQDDFANGLWDQVIKSLEEVYVKDPNYALGTARQTLYEAYVARGQNMMTAGKYTIALSDFERAAVLAAESSAPALRVFNAQTKIAWAQGSLGNYQDATLIYQNVFDSISTVDAGVRQDPSVKPSLTKAENYLKFNNFKMAYLAYVQTAPAALIHYASLVNYQIQAGDYLTMIANRYNTTISAILQANNLSLMSLSAQLAPGTTLVIPTIKP